MHGVPSKIDSEREVKEAEGGGVGEGDVSKFD